MRVERSQSARLACAGGTWHGRCTGLRAGVDVVPGIGLIGVSRGDDALSSEFEIFAFRDGFELATGVAEALGVPLRPIEVHVFPDGESLVTARRGAGSTGAAPALVVRSLDDPNRKLVEVLFAADALRRQGLGPVGLVAPYLGYMRQDRVFETGQALSQRVMSDLLGRAFDDVLTVEAHLHRIDRLDEIFRCPARSVSAAPVIADWLKTNAPGCVVVGPDGESEPWIRSIAERIGSAWAVGTKVRRGDLDVHIELSPLPSDAREAWIVDDIGSSGRTLEATARLLRDEGLERIGAIVVHALFAADAPSRLRDAGISRIVSSDSLPHATNTIGLAEMLAREIRSRRLAIEVA